MLRPHADVHRLEGKSTNFFTRYGSYSFVSLIGITGKTKRVVFVRAPVTRTAARDTTSVGHGCPLIRYQSPHAQHKPLALYLTAHHRIKKVTPRNKCTFDTAAGAGRQPITRLVWGLATSFLGDTSHTKCHSV